MAHLPPPDAHIFAESIGLPRSTAHRLCQPFHHLCSLMQVGPHICVFKTHVDIFDKWDDSIAEQLQQLAKKHGGGGTVAWAVTGGLLGGRTGKNHKGGEGEEGAYLVAAAAGKNHKGGEGDEGAYLMAAAAGRRDEEEARRGGARRGRGKLLSLPSG
eukprot:353833-Chlamydomonas_euryale.AAC.2